MNAPGPWLDHLRLLEDPRREPAVRLSKGVHLVLPLEGEWRVTMALTLRDGRPGSAVPTPTEEAYLLEAASRFLPNGLVRRDRVLCSFAGLRVLRPGHEPTFDASREHLLGVGLAGMVFVAGGKLTTHRPIALDAVRAPSRGAPRRLHPCLDPLPGASPPDERALRSALDAATARHLAELYGGEAGNLLDYAARFPEALERVHPAGPDLWAQVHHAADEEWAVTAEDVTRRRTTLAVRGLDAESVRKGIAAILAEGKLRSVISGPKSFNDIRLS